LVEAYAGFPEGVSVGVGACCPCVTGGVEEVLCAEDIGLEEELRMVDAAVDVAFCGEVDHEIKVVLFEESVCEVSVADISFDELAAVGLEVAVEGVDIAGVGKQVEDNNAYVVRVSGQEMFDKVGANEAGAACNEVGFHTGSFLSAA